ncbi:WD domain, G-beta repeat [Popillia japonica]|uniref:WD repeat-containing protein 89 n=1 Tax=Popillia japonica TaxID=7064 RepID=A0AAW1KJS4_POPJA
MRKFVRKVIKLVVLHVFDSDSDGVDDTEEVADCDVCDEETIRRVFNLKCEAVTNQAIDKDKYILYLDGTLNSSPNVVVGLSGNTVEVYNFSNNRVAKLQTFEVSGDVTGVKSSRENNNIFYVGSKNCCIDIIDLRSDNKISFKDTTVAPEDEYKPLNCLDISSNNLLLCGGTDLYAGDAYILFWDIRKVKLLGAYWESHTDDITQVKFHPDDPNKLISGSTDGLINLYDLSQSSEDDAFIDCLNTESSIEELSWFREDNKDMVACVTHTSDLQTWRLEDAQPYGYFHKEEIAKELKRKLEDYCYVASIQVNTDDKLVGLIGSNFGNGSCLRGFGVDKRSLLPLFDVKGNEQRVRCSWLQKNSNILIMGGEAGSIDVWSVETNFGINNKRKKL